MSGSNAFKIGKYNFEINFNWASLGGDGERDINEHLKETGQTCFVSLKGISEYAGSQIGTKDEPSIKGRSHSLASYVFRAIEADRFIFFKQLGDGAHYYLSIENGYIQDGCDLILDDLAEVQSLISKAGTSGVPVFVDSSSPDSLVDGEAYDVFVVEEHLDDFKPDGNSLVRTTSDARNKTIKTILVVAVSIAILYGLSLTYSLIKKKWDESKQSNSTVKTRAQIELENYKEAEKTVAKRLLLKTKGLSADNQMQACLDSYVAQNGLTSFGGWTLQDMECSQRGLVSVYSQNNLFDATPENFERRFSDIKAVKVGIKAQDNWLKTATITNNIGAMGKSRREGLLPDDLPAKNQVVSETINMLGSLKKLGYNVVNYSEKPEVFSEDENIPPELIYNVGTITFQLTNVDQAMVLSSLLSREYVSFGKIGIYDIERPQINGVEDGSLKHTMTLNYFYR